MDASMTEGWPIRSVAPGTAPSVADGAAARPAGGRRGRRPLPPFRAGERPLLPTPTAGWGWAPALGLIAAGALLLIAVADTGARASAEWAEPLFWFGLVALYAPIVARLAAPDAARGERLALILMLGGGLYLVKIMHSPLGVTHHDEFIHWRTTRDILDTGRLFPENALLPVSPLYSGLENATAALASLSGLSIFISGAVVVGAARLVVVGALFLFYEQVADSAWVAGLATALYMANPTFVYFGGMFKYESLALAFFGLTLAALARRERATSVTARIGLTVVALVALAAVAVTHHLTAYALLGLLALWLAIARLRRGADGPGLTGFVVVAAMLNVGWLLFVASITVGYLAPLFTTAVLEIVRLMSLEQGSSRQLFTSASGEVAPLWQRATGIASVALILSALPFGLWAVWRRHRRRALALALAVVALGYPATLALRLVGDERGWEVSHRSSVFVFLALGFLVALAIERWLARRPGWLGVAPVVVAASIIFLGGMIGGWPPKWRLPGPYLVAAATRSVEPQGIAAALWARVWLGPDNRIATDSVNYMLMGSYGEQYYVSTLNGGVDTSWVFYAPAIGPGEIDILRRGRISYLVVDRRLTSAPPMLPPYAGGDPRGKDYTRPVPAAALAKFDQTPGVSRVFDSGDIVIYDVRGLTGGP
jgi:hypothetical protein